MAVASTSSKPRGKGKGKDTGPKVKTNVAKRQRQNDELRELQQRVDVFIPLSALTLKGLKSSHFVEPTPIQSLAIPPALQGRDILGSARTGSGKTLGFLIPLLERLYLARWGPMDGLGAVVISPTRELAVQTFSALRDIGRFHSFSAGLVIGGKPLKEERDRLARMNILIATPGRLLQHLDSTVGFESGGVKVLADRLLDMGFMPALRAITSHFSGPRQTLLFSATQTADLNALARLSLRDPLYINCNKPGEEGVVPSTLEQFYAVVPLQRKLDALWGFVKSHLKMKGVVFVASGKQVRFVFETFRRLHPGLPLVHLHGKQKQPTRMAIFERFSKAQHALLICTDIAARGLDFPAVDWVVQLDCPDDVDTYIHRVGRTARYQSEGKALAFLCPSEEDGMKQRWADKGLDVKRIKIKESKMGNLDQQMQSFAFKEPEIKYLGQRAFISYLRSIFIQKDKSVFKFDEYPADAYAASMGLPGAPQIKLGGKAVAKERGPKVVRQKLDDLDEDDARIAEGSSGEEAASSDDDASGGEVSGDSDEGSEAAASEDEESGSVDDDEASEDEDAAADEVDSGSGSADLADPAPTASAAAPRTKYDRMFERTNQSILTPHYTKLVSHGGASDDEGDDIFTLARRDHDLESGEAGPSSADLSRRALKAGTSRKAQLKTRGAPTKVVFGDDGEAREFYEAGEGAEAAAATQRDEYVRDEQARMREADKVDRAVARDKKRERKRKRKEREREARLEAEGGGGDLSGSDGGFDGAVLGSPAASERSVSPAPAKRKRAAVDDDDEDLALRLLRGE